MEKACVTAATGALGPVVAKLDTLLQRRHGEYKLRRGTRKDIKVIRSKLNSIHSILWVIWGREDRDAEGKVLRMEAWRLADDMNDAIDDFILTLTATEGGRCFMQDKTQPSPFQDLRTRADDVSQRCRNKWKNTEAVQTTISRLFPRRKNNLDESGLGKRRPRAHPYVYKDILELVGLEESKDKLIGYLVGEEDSTSQLKMASIHGAAGSGKTTLARLVYEAIQDKFEARAFVSITSSHNMKEVLTRILQQVTAQSIPVPLAATKLAGTEKHLIKNISSFLKDKRYMVIIDDIWHLGEWEIINKSLPDNNLGSRVVTTSRVKSITEMWRDDFDAYVVHEFSHAVVDAMIGDEFRRQHHIHIMEMCRGMPLAVTCMISAFAKDQERQQQGLCALGMRNVQDRIVEQVMRNGIQNTPGFEPLVESLELGYNDLPHHMLKTCLLYCSIYPEGHEFKRDDLVIRWIAEGFVCKQETAEGYIEELVSRRLIEDYGSSLRHVARDHVSYVVQPMMRNYLRQKLREDNFITCTSDGVPSSPLIGRLCIDYWPSSDAVEDTLSGIDWHHIRSLIVLKDAEKVPYERLQQLRVLDVQYDEEHFLENRHLKYICGMLYLRHLLLSGGGIHKEGITEMPAEIARLQYLETLEVHYTRITRLPAEIGDLKQLKTLDVCVNQIGHLPREIGNLQQLETLRFSKSYTREQPWDWEIIRTLKKLKTVDMSYNGLSETPRDIGELQQLEHLDVSWNPIKELPKEIWKLQHLKTLNLTGTGITELPREIKNLEQLKALYLHGVKTIIKLPREIGKLQNLETLALRGTNVKRIPREIGGLKKLKILNVKTDIGTLPFEAGQISKLEGLPKCVRKAWRNSDLLSSLAGEILSFDFKRSSWDWIGDGGLTVGTKHMHMPPWIKGHFNNVASLDIRICKLEEQHLKVLREMPCLENLTLRFQAVPREPIDIIGGGFAKLCNLTVDSRVPRIAFQEGAMPSLVWLKFDFQFYGGPPNTDQTMGIKHLVNLKWVTFQCNEWYRADSPCISATIDVLRKEAMEHPKKITFRVLGKKDEIFPENSIIT